MKCPLAGPTCNSLSTIYESSLSRHLNNIVMHEDKPMYHFVWNCFKPKSSSFFGGEVLWGKTMGRKEL